jgi:hypothetical protein
VKGIVVGLLIAALVLSCAVNNRRADTEMQVRIDKMNEITALWVEIRRYRGDLEMPLDPPVSMMNEFRAKTVKDARRVCSDNHARPATCQDSCTLSDHICENAELICKIADELGKHDRAQEKCTSSKASCREAKQKCCDKCSKAPPAEPPTAAPAIAPTKASAVTPKKAGK